MKPNVLFHLWLAGTLTVTGCRNMSVPASPSATGQSFSELKKRNLSLDAEVFVKTAAAGDLELTVCF